MIIILFGLKKFYDSFFFLCCNTLSNFVKLIQIYKQNVGYNFIVFYHEKKGENIFIKILTPETNFEKRLSMIIESCSDQLRAFDIDDKTNCFSSKLCPD
jgi:hypothetical protein